MDTTTIQMKSYTHVVWFAARPRLAGHQTERKLLKSNIQFIMKKDKNTKEEKARFKPFADAGKGRLTHKNETNCTHHIKETLDL